MTTTTITPINQPLLVVEDSDEDFFAFERIVRRFAVTNPIFRCSNGDEALEFLFRTGDYSNADIPRPAIILLDLNLPGVDGREVLQIIKKNQDLKEIPVVVFTTSSNPKDIASCYRQGANSYIIKPIDLAKLQQTIHSFVEYWLRVCKLPGIDSEL